MGGVSVVAPSGLVSRYFGPEDEDSTIPPKHGTHLQVRMVTQPKTSPQTPSPL
jgi:hypothetical protein